MKKFVFLALAALPLAACQTAEQNAALGALGGAAVGAAVSSDSDRTTGALVGAAAGVAASTLLGRSSTPGQCVYRDSRGERYVAACP
jgi:hypothetical protein